MRNVGHIFRSLEYRDAVLTDSINFDLESIQFVLDDEVSIYQRLKLTQD